MYTISPWLKTGKTELHPLVMEYICSHQNISNHPLYDSAPYHNNPCNKHIVKLKPLSFFTLGHSLV